MQNPRLQSPDSQGQIETWLADLVAGLLGLPGTELDTDTHLSCYGLDSVDTVTILTAISDTTGLEIPDDALIEHPTIAKLAGYLRAQTLHPGKGATTSEKHLDLHSLMLRDCILPADIQPPAGDAAVKPAAILLTGATGFLGIHLLDVLLRKTAAHLYCLVRTSGDREPQERLLAALADYGLESHELEDRVTTLAGDLCKPKLGLPSMTYDHLAHSIDAIYHCAADVNWALDYSSLRDTNVLPVADLLRLACLGKKKHFAFVSSISVCYACHGPDTVAEDTPVLPLLDNIHLGYAQSKVVAEALCEQADERGLPVSIHRPALILGNSITGLSNHDDLVSRIIKGCIAMGCAPDLDWPVDACPVNEVADAIYRLSQSSRNQQKITHLVHPQPRRWRELVLWMNIYGYSVELLSYSQWVKHLRNACTTVEHPLYPLRPFLMRRIPEADNLALPELYEEHRRSKVIALGTNAELARSELTYTPLDSALLQRYFEGFTHRRFLSRPDRTHDSSNRDLSTVLNAHFFASVAQGLFCNPAIRLAGSERLNTPADSSIITDLASWKFGKPSGLFHYRLKDGTSQSREIFIKLKPDDEAVLDVAATIGELSVKGIGELFLTFRRQTGLAGCHKRELAVYQQRDHRFTSHVPRFCLLIDNDKDQQWIIALEAIERPIFMDSHSSVNRWSQDNIMTCIDGLASLHSIWLGREPELLKLETMCNALTANDMEDAKPLWYAVARHADSFMSEATGESFNSISNRLIDSIHTWWQAGESLQRTLIHNDFNPRNVAIADRQGHAVLCAYDWELAALGMPQRDLAEFLCFALPPDHDNQESWHYIEHHRHMLERASGCTIRVDEWLYGFQLALYDLAVNRIPMYTLVHRIRPQGFLRRITQTWNTLFREYCDTSLFP
jgi:thioester reductase-like protein